MQYTKHFERNGPEFIMETAAHDSDITDDEYEKLWQTIHGGKKGAALKLRDREYALALD